MSTFLPIPNSAEPGKGSGKPPPTSNRHHQESSKKRYISDAYSRFARGEPDTSDTYINEPLMFDLGVGGPDGGRSIVKSAFSLAVSNGVSPSDCDEAKRYLASGEDGCFGYYYERDLLESRPTNTVVHCVAVHSTDDGLLLGYVELFSGYRMVGCLATAYSGQPIDAVPRFDSFVSPMVDTCSPAQIFPFPSEADGRTDAYPVVPGPPISGGSPATEGWFWLTVWVLPGPSCRIPVAVFLRRGMRLGVAVPLRGFARAVMSQ
jgi:hypothetical protein